jgi:hypothetical protein
MVEVRRAILMVPVINAGAFLALIAIPELDTEPQQV